MLHVGSGRWNAWYWWEQCENQTTWSDPADGSAGAVYNADGTVANVFTSTTEQEALDAAERAALSIWVRQRIDELK